MKKFSRMAAIVVLVLSFMLLSNGATAQSNESQVERKGNVFIAKKSTRGGEITKTNYVYMDSKGSQDTVYLSSTGKAFVFKISKSGNKYKKYLPEVGKIINPSAYEKTKSH